MRASVYCPTCCKPTRFELPVPAGEPVPCTTCQTPLPAEAVANVVAVGSVIEADPDNWKAINDVLHRLNPPKPKDD